MGEIRQRQTDAVQATGIDYDVTGGAVKIGGQDIREICVEALNDQILVAAQGRIVQKGTHPKLAEQSGLYRISSRPAERLSAGSWGNIRI